MINFYSKLKFSLNPLLVFNIPFFLPNGLHVAWSLSFLLSLTVNLCFSLYIHSLKEKTWDLMLDFPV